MDRKGCHKEHQKKTPPFDFDFDLDGPFDEEDFMWKQCLWMSVEAKLSLNSLVNRKMQLKA